MPEFSPPPFGVLIRRMFLELERNRQIFDLPAAKFWRGSGPNTGVWVHGRPAGTPLGPAAGPHTQLAQNIVLSWLAGSRIIELKTVQIDDRLNIPRPCIDATNVCYNVEFSQELLLRQSLEEYVKAWMLIRMLEEAEVLGAPKRVDKTPGGALPHFYDCVFDLSCGYNLEGIRSKRVQGFIGSMMNAQAIINELRLQIPEEFARFRELDYDPMIVGTATLSTFHGCPPEEIEKIVDYLLRENGLHVVIKMNPTMLGEERLNSILHENLGYTEIQVNPTAFASGLAFDDSIEMVRRLRQTGHERGLAVGVKFNNTLEVINHRDFFPQSEKVMYLSGAPLHPIAIELSAIWREAYRRATANDPDEDGNPPVSFSAGVDKQNFPTTVACGFVPVTVCTDLLKPGGYARLFEYMENLTAAMQQAQASTIQDFHGGASADTLANHRNVAAAALADPRYTRVKNSLVPKRINSHLEVFDCLTCDKCIPVCPNDANFTYTTPECDHSFRDYTVSNGQLVPGEERGLKLVKTRQIANYGPFCNECGNCDTFCPEYGGPFIQKPTFFSSRKDWEEFRKYDGFCVTQDECGSEILGRIKGEEYALRTSDSPLHEFSCPAGDVMVDPEKNESVKLTYARTDGPVSMHTYITLRILMTGILQDDRINYVNAGRHS